MPLTEQAVGIEQSSSASSQTKAWMTLCLCSVLLSLKQHAEAALSIDVVVARPRYAQATSDLLSACAACYNPDQPPC